MYIYQNIQNKLFKGLGLGRKGARFLRRFLGLGFTVYYLGFTLFWSLLANGVLLAQTPPPTPAPPPIVVDPSSQETSLDTAPNGRVPIVNIARPNNRGVSHNLFQDFNVGPQGLILNNSNRVGQSTLGGVLSGNPNLQGNQARLIINEVLGANRSELKGYTEIFGRQADYVLSNPYGITCDGCGFINTPRATLTTGRPQFQDGRLRSLRVEGGDISIIKSNASNTGNTNPQSIDVGANTINVDYFDLVSRTVTIQGKVHAKNLRIYGGQNDFYYANQHVVQRPSGRDSNSPVWALDTAALGGMYAETIFISLSEAGAGARVAGEMSATGQDLIITADGRLEIAGNASAQRDAKLRSNSDINVAGSISAHQNIKLNAEGNITVEGGGALFSEESIELEAMGNIDIRGDVFAQGNTELRSQADLNVESDIYAWLSVNVEALNQITVTAGMHLYSRGDMDMESKNMAVYGQAAAGVDESGVLTQEARLFAKMSEGIENLGSIAAHSELELVVGGLIHNQYAGSMKNVLYSNGTMKLYFDSLINDENAQILADSDILMARSAKSLLYPDLTNPMNFDIRATRVTNNSGRIESVNGNIAIYSNTIENKRNNSIDIRHLRDPPGLPGDRDSFDWQTGSTPVDTDVVEIVGNNPSALAGKILSGGDINLYASEIKNMYSVIHAELDLNIKSDSVINEGTQLGTLRTTINWVYNRWLHRRCTQRIRVFRSSVCVSRVSVWGASRLGDPVREMTNSSSRLEALLGAGGTLTVRDSMGRATMGQATVDVKDENTALGGITTNTAIAQSDSIVIRPPNLASADALDLLLPTGNNGLFISNSDPGHPYLIESNTLFTNVDQYVGSDYFFDREGVDLGNFEHYQRLGDPFYETRLIQEEIFDQTGSRFLEDDITDDAEQMLRLFDSAAKQHKALELVPGITLSAEQVSRLQSDMIWMIKKVVQGKEVLVPKLYLSKITKENLKLGSSSIRAHNIDIAAANFVNEGGNVIAKNTLKILTSSGDIRNTLGVMDGNAMVLDSAANILNEGGSIMAERLLAHAVGDIVNEAITERIQTNENNYVDIVVSQGFIGTRAQQAAQADAKDEGQEENAIESQETRAGGVGPATNQAEKPFSHLAGLAFIDPNTGRTVANVLEVLGAQESGFLGMTTAEGSILNKGARIVSEGKTQLIAGENIEFGAIGLDDKSERHYSGGFEKKYTRTYLTGGLSSLGDLTMRAAGDIKIGEDFSRYEKDALVKQEETSNSGSSEEGKSSDNGGGKKPVRNRLGIQIHTDGNADISAGRNITIKHLLDEDYFDKQTTTTEEGLFSDKTTVERWGHDKQTVLSSGISAGGNLNLNAGGQLALFGSILEAGEDLRINNKLATEDSSGKYLDENGKAIDSVVVRHATAKDESWHDKKTTRSYLGMDEDSFGGKLFTISALALALGVDLMDKAARFAAPLVGLEKEYNKALQNTGADKLFAEARNIKESSFEGPTEKKQKWINYSAFQSSLTAEKGELDIRGGGNIILQAVNLEAGKDISFTSLSGGLRLENAREYSSYSSTTKGEGTMWITDEGDGYSVSNVIENNMQYGGKLKLNLKEGVDMAFRSELLTERVQRTTPCRKGRGKSSCSNFKTITREETDQEAADRMLGEKGWQADLLRASTSNTGSSDDSRSVTQAQSDILKELNSGKLTLSGETDTFDDWNYNNSRMTKEAQIGLTIAVGIATGGVGGVIVGAGLGALASQASVNMVNSLGKGEGLDSSLSNTLEELTSEDSLKQIAVAAATAGAIEGLGDIASSQGWSAYTDNSYYIKDLGEATARASINTATYGGNLGENFLDEYKNSAIDALGRDIAGAIGDEYAAGSISNGPGNLDYWKHKGAHALLGCGIGQAKSGDCGSGASGAVIAEVIGEAIGKGLVEDGEFSNADRWLLKTASTTAAIFGTSFAGGDAEVAQDTAQNAVDNNLFETLWDIASLGFGSAEFYLAYKKGDRNGMIEAATAMGMDIAAAALPFVPGGVGAILKAKKAGEGVFKTSSKQLGKKIGKHVKDFGGNPSSSSDRRKLYKLIKDIGTKPDKVVQGKFRGQGPNGSIGKAEFRIKGNNVVVTKLDGSFITILKNGVGNSFVKNALKRR